MLAEFKDYLKTLELADHYYIGKIDNSKLNVLGLYSSDSERIEAFGKDSTYDIAGFKILLHWNRNAVDSEARASLLYETIRYIKEVQMGDLYVAFIELDKPIFIGTDDNNVYEYTLNGRLYYGR